MYHIYKYVNGLHTGMISNNGYDEIVREDHKPKGYGTVINSEAI